MLLKVRLPASIPKMSLSMNDVDLTLSALPSSSTILLSMVAVFVLLSFVRALYVALREHLAFVSQRKAHHNGTFSATGSLPCPPPSPSAPSTEKASSSADIQMQIQQQQRRPISSWLWGLVKWETLPAFPLDAPSLQHGGIGRGVGVGMGEKQRGWFQLPPSHPSSAHAPLASPPRPAAFDRPPPAAYQSEAPVSMAKMIMSRHTFRRPASRPPPARSATVQIQVHRRHNAGPAATPLLPPSPTRPTATPPLVIPTPSGLSRPLTPSPPNSRSPSPTSPVERSRTPSPTRRSPSPPNFEDRISPGSEANV